MFAVTLTSEIYIAMAVIEKLKKGQRYYQGIVLVDDREIYAESQRYTSREEARRETDQLAEECRSDFDISERRSVQAIVRRWIVTSFDDDGEVGNAETV